MIPNFSMDKLYTTQQYTSHKGKSLKKPHKRLTVPALLSYLENYNLK